jgi:hypothetical protein
MPPRKPVLALSQAGARSTGMLHKRFAQGIPACHEMKGGWSRSDRGNLLVKA